jgi:hypothetical protein
MIVSKAREEGPEIPVLNSGERGVCSVISGPFDLGSPEGCADPTIA